MRDAKDLLQATLLDYWFRKHELKALVKTPDPLYRIAEPSTTVEQHLEEPDEQSIPSRLTAPPPSHVNSPQ